MKNNEIIWISKPGEINLEGLQIQILADEDGNLRGINVREMSTETKIIRKVFISNNSELDKFATELMDILASR